MTGADVVKAARRAAFTMADDEAARPYSADTTALVLACTVEGFAGAGSADAACLRVAQDERLAHLPDAVIADLFRLSMRHFAKALADTSSAR